MLSSLLMKKRLTAFVTTLAMACLFAGLAVSPAEARTKKHKIKKKTHRVVRRPSKRRAAFTPNAEGRYADIVIDARTGRILHATDASKERHPASLTKMMTLYLTFQAVETGRLGLNQRLLVSANAASQSPTKLGLRGGQTISVRDAVLGLVTESANDAAVVLAEAMGGTTGNFAAMMTREAHALGMTGSHFENPSGLPDDEQVTTARDMAMLAHALIYHYPRFYPFFSQESFVYAGRAHHNHNHLMERYDGMDGIKTGFIRASGFNLVASARRGDMRLIGVVFGGRSAVSRDNQMAQLLDRAFAAAGHGDGADGANEDVAQGDGADHADEGTIPLPSKASVVFGKTKVVSVTPTPAPSAAVTASAPSSEAQTGESVHENWGLQLGAFAASDQAQQLLDDMQRRFSPMLSRTTPVVQKISASNGDPIYRARFVGMNQGTARSICAYIIKHGQGCLLVPPDVR